MRDIRPGKPKKNVAPEISVEVPAELPKKLSGSAVPMANIKTEAERRPTTRAPRLGGKERSIVFVLLIIAALTAGLAAFIFLPQAKIDLVLRTAPLLVDEEVTLRADGAEIASVVPGTSFFRETEIEGTAPVASTEVVGTKATGTVRLINRTLDEQKIKAQSRLVTENGTLYFMTQTANIPAASGSSLAGIDVTVEAAEAGEAGNFEKGRLNFAALDKSSQSLVYGEAQQAIKGGTGEIVSVVKEDDLAVARKSAGDLAREEVQKSIQDEMPKNWAILEESWQMDVLDFATEAKVDDRSLDIPFKARVAVRVMGFEQEALEKVLELALTSRLEDNFMLFPGPISFNKTVKDVDWEAGEAVLSARVTHTTIPELSLETLREKLSGRSKDDATSYLEGLPGVRTASLETWPFWVNSVPRIQSRIKLDLTPERQP